MSYAQEMGVSMSLSSVMLSSVMLSLLQMSYAQEMGVSMSLSSVILCTLGGSTAAGRVLFGQILQRGYIDRLRMDQLSMVTPASGSQSEHT